ncbi:phosphoribosylglycinamide formyltransferase [Candidatus Latescibacterota bacterium]
MIRLRIGVLASGGGSNLQSIIDASENGSLLGDVVVVISNNSGARALNRARNHSIDALHISSVTAGSAEVADAAITDVMKAYDVDLVVLAGYMKKIGSLLLDAYQCRIVNIHPALLPKFGGQDMYGMNVHRAVIEAGETESGPTVHFVDEKYDHGDIITQIKVPVMPDDTPELLQKRVLEQEHRIFPEAINTIAEKWDT